MFALLWSLIAALLLSTTFRLRQNFQQRLKLVEQLQEALAKVKTLSGFLPICGHCKQVRNDEGYWCQLETYIRDNSDAEFSHTVCPKCVEFHYPEIFERLKEKSPGIFDEPAR
jgi:hypothetical protein